MPRFRTFLFRSITVLLSTAAAFLFFNLCTNIFAMQLFCQEHFPRGWNNYVGQCYRTLYAHAHDGKLEEWTAILGDGYAAGAGDAYLTGDDKYSVAHFLREQKPENFLIFSRGGSGNINAVSEFVIGSKEMSDAWFLPDTGPPNQIIFLFYEGNDITDNLRYLRSAKTKNEQLHSFVIDEVMRPADLRRKIDYYLPLLLPAYLGSKYVVRSALGRSHEVKVHPIETHPKDAKIVNSFHIHGHGQSSQTIEVAKPMQNAAVELNRGELDLGIDVFFECADFLSKSYPSSELITVYVPSPATIYRWQNPIEIQTESYRVPESTTIEKNNERSEYIRHRIALYMASKHIKFIDSTEAFRSNSESHVLHGPTDWHHFNAKGYALLADVLGKLRDL